MRDITHKAQTNVDIQWKKLWKMKLHDRLKMMVWSGTDTFPTRVKIASRMGPIDTSCPLCCEEEESIIHLFFKCPVSRAI